MNCKCIINGTCSGNSRLYTVYMGLPVERGVHVPHEALSSAAKREPS